MAVDKGKLRDSDGIYQFDDSYTDELVRAIDKNDSDISSLNNDTGWISPSSLSNNWKPRDGNMSYVAYRKVGKVVYIRAIFNIASGDTPTGGAIFDIPVGFRPTHEIPGITAGVWSNTVTNCWVTSGGVVASGIPTTTTGWVVLNIPPFVVA